METALFLDLSRNKPSDSKVDFEKWDSMLTPIFNLWKKLNQVHTNYLKAKNVNYCFCNEIFFFVQGLGIIQLKLDAETTSETAMPIEQFCALEWRHAVELVQKIHKSLASLMKVMRGALVPSREIADVATSIIEHQVNKHSIIFPKLKKKSKFKKNVNHFLDAERVVEGLGRPFGALALRPDGRVQGTSGAEVAAERHSAQGKSHFVRVVSPGEFHDRSQATNRKVKKNQNLTYANY
jgi:Dynein heavy chain C-terminal domain